MQYHQRAIRRPQQRKKPIYAAIDMDDEQEPASQQYAGHYAGLHAEDAPTTTAADIRQQLAQHRTYPSQKLTPRSTRRYQPMENMATMIRNGDATEMPDGILYRQGNEQVYVHRGPPPIPQRAGRTIAQPPAAQSLPSLRPRRRLHWMVWIGLVLLVMLIGYIALEAFSSWWQVHQDDSTYGRPRTFQINVVVGHDDSQAHPSHFIAINLNRHVIVIEIPGGDISKSIIYSGPVLLGDGQDLTPVTLTFTDVNGDGRPDMELHVLDQTIIFLNNGTKFVPPSNLVSWSSYWSFPGGNHQQP